MAAQRPQRFFIFFFVLSVSLCDYLENRVHILPLSPSATARKGRIYPPYLRHTSHRSQSFIDPVLATVPEHLHKTLQPQSGTGIERGRPVPFDSQDGDLDLLAQDDVLDLAKAKGLDIVD